MTPSIASSSFFFLFSRPTKPSPVITFFSRSAFCVPSLQTKKARRRDGEDVFDNGNSILEEEIFEFMRKSKKPDTFPTKKELIEAGRRDLAEAVASQGGWLAFGWDLEKEVTVRTVRSVPEWDSVNGYVEDEVEIDYRKHETNSYQDYSDYQTGVHPDYPEASFSGRSIVEEESKEKGGIEGILKRLERERSLLHLSKPKKSKNRAQNGRASFNKPQLDPGNGKVSLKQRSPINLKANHAFKEEQEESSHNGSQNGKLSILNGSNGSVDAICEKWTRWSLNNDKNSSSINNNIQDVETNQIDETKELKFSTQKDIRIDNNNNIKNGINKNNNIVYNNVGPTSSDGMELESLSLEREEINLRLQHLESNLNSALNSLRYKVKSLLSRNLEEDNVSDDWEFRETEIMNCKTEVRSLRARLSVLEGKMALKIIEAQKLLEENQKKLEFSQLVMCGLKTVSIVWSNPASEVLIVGSFDGWTNQRTMEKSREGMFSLNLTLYPGQYEIKFVVDGVWKVDPLRPVVHNNGHENNLLTVV